MATAAAAPDLRATLQNFLLFSFIEAGNDPLKSRQENENSLSKLEAFVLRFGPEMLPHLSSSFNVNDWTLATAQLASKWFVTFLSSLDSTWLRAADVTLIQRFWTLYPNLAFRRSAIELMAKIERSDNTRAARPDLSSIVPMFRRAQPDPWAHPLSPEADSIAEAIFARAMLTSEALWKAGGTLADYMLRVLRYCFIPRGDAPRPGQIERILASAGELTDQQRKRFEGVIASAK